MKKNRLYSLGQSIFRVYFKVFHKIEVIGKENIPLTNGAMVCSNHISNLDPPLVGAFSPRQVKFMAKSELFEKPILSYFLPKIDAFPIKRGESDRQALRKGLSLLKNHDVVGVFPEGTRSKDGALGKGLAGVGFFALRSDAAILPCAIIGKYKPFKKITLIYGKPIDMQRYRDQKTSPEEATAVIMEQIKVLIDNHQAKKND